MPSRMVIFDTIHPTARYGLAVLFVLAAVLLRYAMMSFFGIGYQYITLYPAIVVVSALAGLGPAILTGVLGSLIMEYYFTPGFEVRDLPGMAIVLATSILAGWLAQRLHNALAQTKVQARSLEDKNKELETIIGIVSHDLRAPLVNITGFAAEIGKDHTALRQSLEKDPSWSQSRKKFEPVFASSRQSLDFIISSAQAMENLAVSLVRVARAGLGAISPECVDMDELIHKAVAGIEFKLRQNNAACDIQADMPPCFGDKLQITQIFTNLLDNAVKYLDPGRPGKICIGWDIEADHALYWVADNGIGISFEDQQKIFEPYYQLGAKAAGGVGLGLATVKRMVDRNNGRIWVDSEKGKGTTFYVALPMPHPR